MLIYRIRKDILQTFRKTPIFMASSHSRTRRLKPILDKVPPGYLVDTDWLTKQGVDSKSIHRYVSQRWIERVVRGVYRRPVPIRAQDNAPISWESVILSLQRVLNYDVYLGGVSALELAGFQHYLYFGGTPEVHFYGSAPLWVNRIPLQTKILVHTRTLFGDDRVGIGELSHDVEKVKETGDVWRWSVITSLPERAILEAIDLVRTTSDFENLDKIFQSLTTLRPNTLMSLLKACRSIKVRRLFFVFAEKHAHLWLRHLDVDSIDFGSGPRALIEGGRIHPVYQIYVPTEFVPVTLEAP